MRKSRRKRRRRRRTRRRGAGKKRRKQTFQPWKGKHSFNNNDISYYARSVESEGNFPDTTNGELSMEKTIEGQQARNDGGGAGQAESRRHYEEAGLFNNAPKKAPKKDLKRFDEYILEICRRNVIQGSNTFQGFSRRKVL